MIRKRYATVWLVAGCLVLGLLAGVVPAADMKDRFYQAEKCRQALDNNAAKKQYRSNWLNCINQFMAVHDDGPSGPWAAAALYRAGVLYQALYRYSRRSSDHQAAVDIFHKVVANYPKSSYRDRAREQLAAMTEQSPDKGPTAASPAAERGKEKYSEAETCYQKLSGNAARKKYRCYWLDCINGFYDVYKADPAGPWAAAGLYMAGTLYGELYRYSYAPADREEEQRLLQRVVEKFPQSSYKDKAAARLRETGVSGAITTVETPAAAVLQETQPASSTPVAAVLTIQEAQPAPSTPAAALSGQEAPPVSSTPATEAIQEARPAPSAPPAAEPPLPEGIVLVKALRYWSNPTYTRVVIDATGPAEFNHNLLSGDPAADKPLRLYIDLQNSRLHQELSRELKVDDNLLNDIRAGQYTNTSVRVVVDIKSFKSYKVFSLRDPFRVVIDVSGQEGDASPVEAVEQKSVPVESGEKTLAQQLGLTVRRIVIDPGHGGKDGGAPGYIKGVQEKKLVLDLSRDLADRIRKELGCEVIMTRESDKFLTLEERTAIANMKNADLFISVHTNASRNRNAYGIETYLLNLATDEDAMQVAAMENSTSLKNISDLQSILQDLMQNAKKDESIRLAGYVQGSLYGHLQKRYSKLKNKGVKQAPFYVLLGAQMPSVLIETGFISNKEECRRLMDPDYQRQVCDGIVKGIKDYIEQTSSAGFAPSQEEPPVTGLMEQEQEPGRPSS